MWKLIFIFSISCYMAQATICTGIYYEFPDNSTLEQSANVSSTCQASYCAQIDVTLEDKTTIKAMDCLDTLVVIINNYLQGKHGTTEDLLVDCNEANETLKEFRGPGNISYTIICSANSTYTSHLDHNSGNAMMLNLLLICFALILKF